MTSSGFSITKLSDDDMKSLVIFDCYNEDEYKSINLRKKKEIKRLSVEMNKFLQNEALKDQVNGYNTTFLLKFEGDTVGYMSLCADGIKLDLQERRRNSIPYEMVPALKIARLAIDKKFQKHGLANFMIRYAVYKLLVMRKEMCGVKFMTLDCFPHRLKYYKDIGFIENQTRVENGENDRPISMRLVIEDFLEKNKITPPTF